MRLPAEWEKQSGVQLTWPHCDTEWYELEKVLECYVEIAWNILRFEPLMIVTRDIEECKGDIARISEAKGLELDLDRISFQECPLNDTWARDHGGISGHPQAFLKHPPPPPRSARRPECAQCGWHWRRCPHRG